MGNLTLRGAAFRFKRNWTTDKKFRQFCYLLALFFLVLPPLYGSCFHFFGTNWTVKDALVLGYFLSMFSWPVLLLLSVVAKVAREEWAYRRPANAEARLAEKAARLERRAQAKVATKTQAELRREAAQAAFLEAADELYCQLGMNTLASTVAAHDLLAVAKKKAQQ